MSPPKAPIKAIIHEATFRLCAATDGAPVVLVIVGAGVAKRRGKNEIQVRKSHAYCATQLRFSI